jgi:hypothetical protein
MKIIIKSIAVFLCFCSTLLAQTPKTDKIVKQDESILEVIIDEIGEDEILYTLPNAAKNSSLLKIKKAEIWKITYASGKTIILNQKMEATPQEKSDRIVRKGGQVINGKIISVSPQLVKYTTTDANKGEEFMLSGKDVERVEYADGTIKDFSSKSNKKKDPNSSTKKPKKDTRKKDDFSQQVAKQKKSSKPRQLLDIPRLVIGVGAEGTYILEPLSKQWVAANDSAGLQQGIGLSFRADFHITKGIALSASVGYNLWQVQRNYVSKDLQTQTNIVQYSSTDKFGIIPVQAGIKLYLAKGFYIMPEASYNIIVSNYSNNNGAVPNPNGTIQVDTKLSKLGYGGSIGFEVYKKSFIIDVSARFNMIQANNFRNFNEPLTYAGLRLGIGFGIDK